MTILVNSYINEHILQKPHKANNKPTIRYVVLEDTFAPSSTRLLIR